jgi:hypothetical protein
LDGFVGGGGEGVSLNRFFLFRNRSEQEYA